MKRVAFLDYSPVFAGAERVLYNVIAHIDRSKYEPVIVFPYPMEHQKRYDTLNCEKIYLSDGLKWWMGSDRWEKPIKGTDFVKRFEYGRRIARLIKRRKIDILDVNLMRRDIKMWVWATRKFTDAKIIGHYRSQAQDWVAPADAQRLFDCIACVSAFSRMRFQLKGAFVRSEVLYDSVDIDVMKCDKNKADAKQEFGYSNEDILLVSVGQLSLHKGHDTAIRAFARITEEFPTAKLLVAGGGSDELVKYYRDLANSLGVANKVTIPGKQLGNIQNVYRAANLTLSLTKVGEGFGLVPYESTLLGTPFIAPDFGAVKEFVEDGETGFLVDTNNLDAVTEKIRFVLSNQELASKTVENLTSIIHSKLHPSVLTENLDKLYSSL